MVDEIVTDEMKQTGTGFVIFYGFVSVIVLVAIILSLQRFYERLQTGE